MQTNKIDPETQAKIKEAARLIRQSRHLAAFTGAGISTESGIPSFRGPNGLWSKYNPKLLQLSYFRHYPAKSWPVLKEIFYEYFADAKPNDAHRVLERLEHERPGTAGPRGKQEKAGTEETGRGDSGGQHGGRKSTGLLKVLITQNIDSVL